MRYMIQLPIKNNRGFTLIETIVYIALLNMLMTGVLLCVYGLIGSIESSHGKTMVQDEGVFVRQKIGWALADMSAQPTTGGSGCAQTVSITKTSYANNPVEFRRNTASNAVEMREGGTGAYVALTTPNVLATCLSFTAIAAAGAVPPGIIATVTISGFDFVHTKYVRP